MPRQYLALDWEPWLGTAMVENSRMQGRERGCPGCAIHGGSAVDSGGLVRP